jgi:hypothetical protein
VHALVAFVRCAPPMVLAVGDRIGTRLSCKNATLIGWGFHTVFLAHQTILIITMLAAMAVFGFASLTHCHTTPSGFDQNMSIFTKRAVRTTFNTIIVIDGCAFSSLGADG